MSSISNDDPRVSMAAERTLLAWIRTGLALMGLGFVMARFGLFLREMALVSKAETIPPTTGFSVWIGSGLLLMGSALLIISTLQHIRTLNQLKRGEPYLPSTFSLSVIVAILSAGIGVLMAAYMLVMK